MLHLGIFIAVTAGSLTLLRAILGFWQPHLAQIRRRFAGEFGGANGETASRLYKDLDTLDDPTGEFNSESPQPRLIVRWRHDADNVLRQAGVKLSIRQFLMVVGASAATCGGIGLALVGWIAGACGVIVGGMVPILIIGVRRKTRQARYLQQLVGAFELMARVLRAGQSISEAFRAAGATFEEPLSVEFGQCVHQIEHGLRPESAYRELSERSGLVELHLFVVVMRVQQQVGGNLAEVLDRIAMTIRSRLRLMQKLRALTAEGRLQSWTLFVLPPVTFLAMYFLNPQYAEVLLENPRLILGTVGPMLIGMLWIRNIMRFEG